MYFYVFLFWNRQSVAWLQQQRLPLPNTLASALKCLFWQPMGMLLAASFLAPFSRYALHPLLPGAAQAVADVRIQETSFPNGQWKSIHRVTLVMCRWLTWLGMQRKASSIVDWESTDIVAAPDALRCHFSVGMSWIMPNSSRLSTWETCWRVWCRAPRELNIRKFWQETARLHASLCQFYGSGLI